MAEALLKKALGVANKKDCNVSSAGLNALVDHQPDPSACQLMLNKGIDISGYRARQINKELIREADLILVMELNQKSIIEENEPSARGKIYRLGEWEKVDIDDPYRKEYPAFVKSLALIEQGVSQWMKRL